MNKLENPINLLICYRLEKIINEFDIKMENFSFGTSLNDIKTNWLQLKQKLILHKYVTNDSDFVSCRVAILNIIWKNIIIHKAIGSSSYCHMIYSGYINCRIHCEYPSLYKNILLEKTRNNMESNNNLDILQQKIINNLLLVDQIIIKYLLVDLLHIINMCIFDVWLII